ASKRRHRPLDHHIDQVEDPKNHESHHPRRVWTSDLLWLKALQRVLERLGRKRAGELVNDGIRRTLRPVGTPGVALPILDLLNGHGVPSRPQGPNRSPRPHTLHRRDPSDRATGPAPRK